MRMAQSEWVQDLLPQFINKNTKILNYTNTLVKYKRSSHKQCSTTLRSLKEFTVFEVFIQTIIVECSTKNISTFDSTRILLQEKHQLS